MYKRQHLTIEKAIIEVKEGIGITTYDDGTRVTFKDGEIKVEYGFGIGTVSYTHLIEREGGAILARGERVKASSLAGSYKLRMLSYMYARGSGYELTPYLSLIHI